MNAAIYCRKSTPQRRRRDGQPVDVEDKSIVRQEDEARRFCAERGWTVVAVYADDEVGGAETTKLAGKQTMLAEIASGRAAYAVLVVQANDRLSRRDGDEAIAEMKAIARQGIEIWFYSTGRRFEFGTFEANTVGFLSAEFAAQFRRDIARKTREALARKFRLGHVVGGVVYGYRNVDVGSHTERVIDEAEAAIVRRIFDAYAAGAGLATIAAELNAQHAAAPRPVARTLRPNTWSASTVREILKRPLYRGFDVYGRAKKRDVEGKVNPSYQPAETWLRRECPELRIVDPIVSAAVDARFADMRERTLRVSGGRLLGRPPGEGSPYLLTGLLRCGVCGGSMEVLSSQNGRTGGRRVYHYRCYNGRRKGPAVCANTLSAPMETMDAAVLAAVEDVVLRPEVVRKAIALAESVLTADATGDERRALEKALGDAEAAIARLTEALASGAELSSVVAALAAQETRAADLRAKVAALVDRRVRVDAVTLRRTLTGFLADWRKLLRGHVPQAQQILRRLIADRLTMTPEAGGFYSFAGEGTVRPLLAGVLGGAASADAVRNLASPTGFEPVFQP